MLKQLHDLTKYALKKDERKLYIRVLVIMVTSVNSTSVYVEGFVLSLLTVPITGHCIDVQEGDNITTGAQEGQGSWTV